MDFNTCDFNYVAFDRNSYIVIYYGDSLVYLKSYVENYLTEHNGAHVAMLDVREGKLIKFKTVYRLEFYGDEE